MWYIKGEFVLQRKMSDYEQTTEAYLYKKN